MSDVAGRLLFLKDLQKVTNKIHATSNIDEIMLELSQDICNLFDADRLTIYAVAEDGQSIVQYGDSSKADKGLVAAGYYKTFCGERHGEFLHSEIGSGKYCKNVFYNVVVIPVAG